MQATAVDMRYKTKEIFEALERGEKVDLLQRGKLKGRIIPLPAGDKRKVRDHPLFGMEKNDKRPLEAVMDELRGLRYRDL